MYTGANTSEVLVSPLIASLSILLSSNHYDLMKSSCCELIECYGNSSIPLEMDSAVRLKLAVKYLLLATRLENIKRDIDCNVLGLVTDKGLANETCSPELLQILSAVASTSLISTSTAIPEAASSDKKAKLKKQDSAAVSDSSPTARDAIFVLSSYFREVDKLWLDSSEYAFVHDLMQHLKSFKAFADHCCVTSLPSEKDELLVETASVTSLWQLTRATAKEGGLFDNVTGYFLLGGIKKDQQISTSQATAMTTEEPLLYKLSTSRAQLKELEEYFLHLGKVASEAQNKENELVHAAKRFASLIAKLFVLLRGGEREGELISAKAKQKGSMLSATLTVNDTQVAELEVTEKMCVQIARTLSLERGAYQLKCDVNICMIFWVAFRLQ